jgi:hypothetical protein
MTEFGNKGSHNQSRPSRESKEFGRLINGTGGTQWSTSKESATPQYSRKIINSEDFERRNLEINNVQLEKETQRPTRQKRVSQDQVAENSKVIRVKKGSKEIALAAVANQNSPITSLVHEALKKEHSYGKLGLVVGVICMLGGIVLLLNGVAGAISWTAKIQGFESQLSDAPSGIALAVVGLFIVLVTKPRVKIRDLR